MSRGRAAIVGAALALAAGCDRGEPGAADTARPTPAAASPAPASPAPAPPSAGVVDSIIPIAEALRRFRADLGDAPSALAGAPSRDALVERFARAVEARDTAAFRDMMLSRAEFAYLYYPESPLSRRPYEEPPALLWFRITQASENGLARLLRRYGGRPLGVASYRCDEPPKREGENALWERCRVRHARAPGDTVEEKLFGSIVRRGGRFKFVGYGNDF